MPKKKVMTTYEVGITYESIAKAVFERIHSEASGITVEVEHLARVEGVTTRHVVDVLWKFRVGGISYTAVVQCKNWNTRVKQEDVFAFKAILADIPGQPRGIIVSRSGLQAGARRVAKASGIVVFQLGPAPKPGIVLSDYGWATYAINKKLQIELTVFNPRVDLTCTVPLGSDISSEALFRPLALSQQLLFDEHGRSVGSMRDIVADMAGTLRNSGQLSGIRTHEFAAPTYMRYEAGGPQLRILSVTANISITPEPQAPIPLLPPGFVRFMLRNLETGESSTHAVKVH